MKWEFLNSFPYYFIQLFCFNKLYSEENKCLKFFSKIASSFLRNVATLNTINNKEILICNYDENMQHWR